MRKFLLLCVVLTTSFVALSAQEADNSALQVSSKNEKFTLTIGGYINLRAAFDFNGIIDGSSDFIPSMIPMSDDFMTQKEFFLDASTSRLQFSGLLKSSTLGDVEFLLNGDMRGSWASYAPRVRLAYVSFMGITIGRNYTALLDLGSLSANIDFQGPNSIPFFYVSQIKYTKAVLENKMLLGAALEYPDYESSTLGADYTYQKPYMPKVIAFAQVNLGESHIRLSGLYKNIPLYNVTDSEDVSKNGWATQLSGSIGFCPNLKLYYSATCGRGVTEYFQDTYGSSLDVIIKGTDDLYMPFTYGWQASATWQLSKRTAIALGYSEVKVTGDASDFAADDYSSSQYVFANIFYNVTSRMQLGAEYLWGSRTNMDKAFNKANQIQMMVQYNF